MKSERRHELQQNVLETEIVRFRDFLRRRGNLLAWVALGIAAVVLGSVYFVKKSRSETAELQSRFERLMLLSPGDPQRTSGLEDLAGKTSYPLWAAASRVALGDDQATKLRQQWFRLSDADRASLRSQAQGTYAQVIADFPREDAAVAKAHLGLGKLAEDTGDLDAARKEYGEIDKMKGSLAGQPVLTLAQNAMNRLSLFRGTVYMPSSAPASGPSSRPASGPSIAPAGGAASVPAAIAPATAPGSRPASMPAKVD